MPYIRTRERERLDGAVHALAVAIQDSEGTWGAANYAITTLLARLPHDNYEQQMELVGTLECVKLEIYRRGIARYEDAKARENGDIPAFAGWY